MQFQVPDQATILEIHEIILEYYGGLKGMLHPEMLESAVHRPNNYMAYDNRCDIHLITALMLESVATYHIFSDGNKRTALVTMLMTYRMNGINLSFDLMTNKRLERLVLSVADDDYSLTVRQLRTKLRRLITSLQPV